MTPMTNAIPDELLDRAQYETDPLADATIDGILGPWAPPAAGLSVAEAVAHYKTHWDRIDAINAALATYRHRRAGSLLRAYVWPLGAYIGVGAVLGAALVGLASGDFIRLAFVAYLAITILDCLLRRGFLSRAEERQARPLGVPTAW